MMYIRQSLKQKILTILTITLIFSQESFAWDIKDAFKGLHSNYTKAGSYQDQQAGYYSGGGLSVRTERTRFNPVSITPPVLTMGCSGIDSYLGGISFIKADEMMKLMKNIGSQAPVYAFSLGLKVFAPQIENALKDLRNLATSAAQFAQSDCKLLQSLFAAGMPRDSAMEEAVCKDIRGSTQGFDWFGAKKKCSSAAERKAAIKEIETKDPELMISNYNLFTKAAEKAGIPLDMRDSLMSMTGTIIVKENNVFFLESLIKDEKNWLSQLNGGPDASEYQCDENSKCLNVSLMQDISITPENSFAGKARAKLDEIKVKFLNNEEFDADNLNFLTSIGAAFPVFDYVSLEAVSGVTILDNSSELIASYVLLQHLKEVVGEIRKAVQLLKAKQVSDNHIKDYLKQLDKIQLIASERWGMLLTKSDQIEKRARLIEQHLMARGRG